ncbi:MAG: prepilin-type N-terminal cleavage/methylation domain-containing protein [Candidatus Aminicenantes bacterium]
MKGFRQNRDGFSLMEVLVGVALVGIAMLGLAQLFTYSIVVNSRADKISNATFLAQQQIDLLRGFTAQELNMAASAVGDEPLDLNSDGVIDYRRLTDMRLSDQVWHVRIMIFPPEAQNVDQALLLDNPEKYKIKADISTIIGR